MEKLSPRDLAALANRLYPTGSLVMRSMQRWRPYICPFGALIVHVPPGSNVLDVGCGGGLFLGLLGTLGRLRHGYGFDSSRAAIGLAREMAARLESEAGMRALHFEYRDAQADWPDGQFDVVSTLDVMHHVPPASQREVFMRAAERVAPGGRLVYKDVGDRPLWRAWASRLHDLTIARQWIHFVPMHVVDAWSREAGLVVSHRESIDMLWYGHELRVYERRRIA
jgi:2-polyprenyl-3-methyl-5-hydroxy-6-metoxy-1,4-benzoquinol methylase